MTTLKATEENIKKAAEIIRKGGLVSFPTETVYGLGADAMNPIAAAKIFEAKERPFFDPLIVHVCKASMVEAVTSDIPELARQLMSEFWPGPLTLVLPKGDNVPDIITSGLSTVAVRMPHHETALKLIETSGTPIAAPSANKFSCLSPTEAKHVENQLGERIDMILDGGQCHIGVESTIVKVDEKGITLLRPGGISIEDIESRTGIKVSLRKNEDTTEAPGQLPFHYSPGKKLIIKDIIEEINNSWSYLFFKKPGKLTLNENCRVLSADGDMEEAAANLFSFLHELDANNTEMIIAEKIPMEGLGRAIMDRLMKASKKYDSHH